MYKFSYELTSTENEKSFSVTWEIPDFGNKIDNSISHFAVSTTRADYRDDIDDDLKFELSVRCDSDKILISIDFRPPNDAFIKCLEVLSHVKGYGTETRELFTKEYCRMSPSEWLLMKVIEIDKLTDFYSSFELRAKFLIRQDVPLKVTQDAERCLKHDLENVLNNTILFDVMLDSVDSIQLPAHKILLAARSDVFKAHFEHGTMESLTNVIKTKFDTEILQEVLHYIYTDCAPKLGNIAAGVLEAADYYQLAGLKSLCAKELYKNLTTENAIETLVLAERHSMSSLKEDILQFLKDENNSAAFESSGWKTLEDVKLVKLLLENMVMK